MAFSCCFRANPNISIDHGSSRRSITKNADDLLGMQRMRAESEIEEDSNYKRSNGSVMEKKKGKGGGFNKEVFNSQSPNDMYKPVYVVS